MYVYVPSLKMDPLESLTLVVGISLKSIRVKSGGPSKYDQ